MILIQKKLKARLTETAEKCSKIMETYLGEDPDTQEALEFLCLAEGGEVTHYEVLSFHCQRCIEQKIWSKGESYTQRRTRTLRFMHKAG